MVWDQVVEDSCRTILEREEEGSPAEYLTPAANVNVEYLLRPLLLDGLPVAWYAPGGSGKSLLAMYVALLVENGLPFQGEPTRRENVLYLDWEVTKAEADRRCTLLAAGLQQTLIGATLRYPLYRRCLGSILDEASEIAKTIAKSNIGLVIVDSAGPACGGDIMSAELAIQFFNTLRKVTASTNAAVGILTHTTKADRREENQRRLPIGSVYFENLARATWEIRPQETSAENVLQVGMFPRKHNMGRPAPVGLKLTFQPNAITVDPVAADDVLSEQGATQSMILGELGRGPLSVSQLIEATGAAPGVVRTLLWKLKKRGQVESPGRGLWSLARGEET
jgi:AAA domain